MEWVFREETPQSHRPRDKSNEAEDCRVNSQHQIAGQRSAEP